MTREVDLKDMGQSTNIWQTHRMGHKQYLNLKMDMDELNQYKLQTNTSDMHNSWDVLRHSYDNSAPLEGHFHDDVIKWKHFPRYWPFVRGIHRSPVNSPHKGQWHGALMFSLICTWIQSWGNNPEAGDFRRHRANCDVSVMCYINVWWLEPKHNGAQPSSNRVLVYPVHMWCERILHN